MSEDTEERGTRPAPGWYPDPWVVGQHRYWDGSAWTGHAFPTETGPRPGPASSPWIAPSDIPPPPPAWDAPVAWTPWVPPPPPPSPPSSGGWRMPTGTAFAALLLAVGLVVGFIATISTFYALGGRSKRVVSSAPLTIPFSPNTTVPPNPLSPVPTVPTLPTLPGGTGGTGGTGGAGGSGGTGGTASCATTPPAVPGESSLSGLIVSQADVPSTVVVQPLPCGNLVTGQTTLDLCNGTFPSESLRTARRQVAAIDDVGNLALSTEAVLYNNAAATTQAISELKTTAAKCPSTPVVSPVGEPTVTTRFSAPPDAAWPLVATVERLAFEFDSTDDTGQTNHSIAVYLRRGRVLMGVYFSEPAATQLSVRGQSSTAGIVNVFANRMAQLPASVVSG